LRRSHLLIMERLWRVPGRSSFAMHEVVKEPMRPSPSWDCIGLAGRGRELQRTRMASHQRLTSHFGPACTEIDGSPRSPHFLKEGVHTRGRRGRFGTLLEQLECGIFGRTAVRLILCLPFYERRCIYSTWANRRYGRPFWKKSALTLSTEPHGGLQISHPPQKAQKQKCFSRWFWAQWWAGLREKILALMRHLFPSGSFNSTIRVTRNAALWVRC